MKMSIEGIINIRGYMCLPEGRRPLGRPRRRWVDNTSIKMDLIQNRVVWTGSICFRIGTSGGLL
jgi:hypothetical protein